MYWAIAYLRIVHYTVGPQLLSIYTVQFFHNNYTNRKYSCRQAKPVILYCHIWTWSVCVCEWAIVAPSHTAMNYSCTLPHGENLVKNTYKAPQPLSSVSTIVSLWGCSFSSVHWAIARCSICFKRAQSRLAIVVNLLPLRCRLYSLMQHC